VVEPGGAPAFPKIDNNYDQMRVGLEVPRSNDACYRAMANQAKRSDQLLCRAPKHGAERRNVTCFNHGLGFRQSLQMTLCVP